jgi:hypothetical protein
MDNNSETKDDFRIFQLEEVEKSTESKGIPWGHFVSHLAAHYTNAKLDALKGPLCGRGDVVEEDLFTKINVQLGVFIPDKANNPAGFWTFGQLAHLYSQEWAFFPVNTDSLRWFHGFVERTRRPSELEFLLNKVPDMTWLVRFRYACDYLTKSNSATPKNFAFSICIKNSITNYSIARVEAPKGYTLNYLDQPVFGDIFALIEHYKKNGIEHLRSAGGVKMLSAPRRSLDSKVKIVEELSKGDACESSESAHA